MYLNLFFSVGKKDNTPPPPTPLHICICKIHQLTDQAVTWLIDYYRRVGDKDPNRSRTQTSCVFTSQRNYQCQNQLIIPFTHRAGGRVNIFEFVLNSVSSQIPGLPGCLVLPSVVLTVIIIWWIKSLDRNCSVFFPAKYKTESQFRLKDKKVS